MEIINIVDTNTQMMVVIVVACANEPAGRQWVVLQLKPYHWFSLLVKRGREGGERERETYKTMFDRKGALWVLKSASIWASSCSWQGAGGARHTGAPLVERFQVRLSQHFQFIKSAALDEPWADWYGRDQRQEYWWPGRAVFKNIHLYRCVHISFSAYSCWIIFFGAHILVIL